MQLNNHMRRWWSTIRQVRLSSAFQVQLCCISEERCNEIKHIAETLWLKIPDPIIIWEAKIRWIEFDRMVSDEI